MKKTAKIVLPIEIGDPYLAGRFKNKKMVVKEISMDNHGQPTINGKTILKIRIPKKAEIPSHNIMDQLRNIVSKVIKESF